MPCILIDQLFIYTFIKKRKEIEKKTNTDKARRYKKEAHVFSGPVETTQPTEQEGATLFSTS
jgi:hypothetical protein